MEMKTAKSDRSRKTGDWFGSEGSGKSVLNWDPSPKRIKKADTIWKRANNTDDKLLAQIYRNEDKTDDETCISHVFDEGLSMSNINLYTEEPVEAMTEVEKDMVTCTKYTVQQYGIDQNISGDQLFSLLQYERLFTKYEKFLTRDNELNYKNSIIDLGDRPIFKTDEEVQKNSKNPQRVKDPSTDLCQNVYLPPRQHTNLMVVTFSECSPSFEIRKDQLSVFQEIMEQHSLPQEEIQSTIVTINSVLKPNRGTLAFYDRVLLFYLLFGLLFTSILCVLVAMFVHLMFSLFLGSLYFGALGIFIWYIKKRQRKLVRDSHFCLALILRAENNRLYLSKDITLRPGFLGKWIEFHFKI